MAENSNEAKKNIAKLIEKYENIKAEGKIGKYSEAQTLNEFIEPLFENLGWDIRNWKNPNEVTKEEKVSNGRADLAFRLNGIPKFFLEAKSLKTDLDVESYSRQAINYSWNKGVSWAVLTDFESLKLYNAQAKSKSLQDKLVFEIPYSEYISDFDRLRLLSKESFLSNELDKYAEKYGKKIKKQTVTEKLYDDLRKAREILTKSFGAWNKDLSQENLDEGVQRILDRLIFIRVLEDKELEEPTLKPLINAWKKDGSVQLFENLTKKFRELDRIYNSNLFSDHFCEKWEEYGKGMETAVALLYGTDMYEYDFKHIPADILGGVYESYLGYIAQNPIEIETDKKSGKLLKFEDKKELKLKSRKKRKEQGIYYTPKYIVDYIVRETLGKKLEEIKSIHELKQLKVLDPACGSGSFLTKALETINDKYKDFGNPGNQDTKTQILIENIHGVDLDSQAVELAKLNLLIDALDKKDKLPDLTENIRVGNSLISGSEEELKKYFGKNWRDKKPFDWEEEFPNAAKQGGFDVIIGNPPYSNSKELDVDDKKYFSAHYKTATDQYDLYVLFVEKALKLLKDDGLFSFIIPNKFLITRYGLALRKFIVENATLISFKDYSSENVFTDASVYPIVLVLQKKKSKKIINDKKYDLLKIFGLNEKEDSIIEKMDSITEIEKFKVWRPLATSKNIAEGKDIVITNREVNRYFFDEDKKGFLNVKRDYDIAKDKIIMKKICYDLEASIDREGYSPINTTYCIKIDTENTNLNYILGVINSKLLSYYVRKKYQETALRGGYIELRVYQIEKLPMMKVPRNKQAEIIKLVDKILNSYKKLQFIPENSEKWKSLKREIEKVDREIDRKVYALYGLTEEEIKIIEK